MEKKKEYIRRIMVASSCVQGIYEKWAKKSHMKHNTLLLLYALNDGKPHTQKSISEEWMISKTTLNTIIKECEKEGYIELKHVAGKKREMEIFLTKEGAAYEQECTKEVSEAEMRAINKTLKNGSPQFIEHLEFFAQCLNEELMKKQEEKNEH